MLFLRDVELIFFAKAGLVLSNNTQLSRHENNSIGPVRYSNIYEETFNYVTISLITSLLLITAICAIACFINYRKNKRLRHQLIEGLNAQAAWSQVADHDNVSEATAEFEYVSFARPKERHKTKLQLDKQKQVQLPVQVHAPPEQFERSAVFVTNVDYPINYGLNHELDQPAGTRFMRVQLSEQTETIVRAIKTELKKFEPQSRPVCEHAYRPQFDPIHFINPATEV